MKKKGASKYLSRNSSAFKEDNNDLDIYQSITQGYNNNNLFTNRL